jgi:hypothetical protein
LSRWRTRSGTRRDRPPVQRTDFAAKRGAPPRWPARPEPSSSSCPLLAVIAAAILLNVVAGHMSLVGPRPLVPGEDALVAARWAARHDHRPGLTGLWQLHRSPQTTVDELIRLDQRYLAQRSAWHDLRLIASTGRSLLGRAGR